MDVWDDCGSELADMPITHLLRTVLQSPLFVHDATCACSTCPISLCICSLYNIFLSLLRDSPFSWTLLGNTEYFLNIETWPPIMMFVLGLPLVHISLIHIHTAFSDERMLCIAFFFQVTSSLILTIRLVSCELWFWQEVLQLQPRCVFISHVSVIEHELCGDLPLSKFSLQVVVHLIEQISYHAQMACV